MSEVENKIFVGAGGSISVGGVSYTPGMVLPEEVVAALEESGELKGLVEGEVLVTLESRLAAMGQAPTEVTLTENKAPEKGTENPPGITPGAKGPWTFNPDDLMDKDLDQLNVMIKEVDADAPVCDDVNEAIAFLSQDLEGEEG